MCPYYLLFCLLIHGAIVIVFCVDCFLLCTVNVMFVAIVQKNFFLSYFILSNDTSLVER